MIRNLLLICACHCFPEFIDALVGHVATGNLDIISYKQLKELFAKGPSYREPQSINSDSLFISINTELKEFIKNWSKKENLPVQFFNEWYYNVIRLVRERIDTLIECYTLHKYQSVFSIPGAASHCQKISNFLSVPF